MRYMLDTNICIHLIIHRPAHVRHRFEAHAIGDIGISVSTGTSRQPSSTWPSALTARSSSCWQASRDACSFGRKIMPTPYSPGGGSSMPCAASSAR